MTKDLRSASIRFFFQIKKE